MVRFGRWDEVLKEPEPIADYGYMNAMWHYARGMAYRHKGKSGPAKQELRKLQQIAASDAMKDKLVGFAPAPAALAIATDILAAELASAGGDHDAAIARLDRAVRAQDGFLYNEPPDWYFPVRHYLGAELLEAGRPAEAEVVYWQDLARNPGNGYALFGLQKAQEAQGKTAEAARSAQKFSAAWQAADVKLASSRF
jgi:tetratricopeptide (TPR) repeat protein